MAKDYDDQTIGGVNLGGLTDYLFVFTNGSEDANWQGATKGFVGDVAVDGLQANERTSGGVPFSGTIYTNDTSAGAWQDIADQNPGTSSVSTGETALIGSLEADLESAFDQIDALSASSGFTSVDASSLDGLNTQNGIAETFVINVTSGFNVDYTIDITGDADDVYILRWDENADASDGYQGTVKFQSGGGINPLGDLSASNFINVAGDINASGGGSTPSGLVDEVSELDGVSGGGFFTGYWLTTGDPDKGDTQSLSNAIFTGGWYTSSDKFSLTSGTSGVYVAPTTAGDPIDPVDPTDPECIKVLENTSPVIADLDCGEGENPDLGKDICMLTHKDMNGFGEDTGKPTSYVLSLGDLSNTLVTSDTTGKVNEKVDPAEFYNPDADDGDGSYYVLVSDQSDPSKALTDNFFAGTVEQGDNFEASGSFGSETFVHIYSSDGGSLLQSINFHTSCSSPLIIGDQYGSITLEGATLVGKDSNTEYTVGATETDGDAGVIYEITKNEFDDDGNPIFQVDPDTGEVTFVSPPDFENPLGDTPDNKYDIEVTAFFVDENGVKTGEICEVKPLEVCVEDDCINILENTSPVIADLDCGEGENPDLGKDICMLTHKDMNGFGEDTGKPTSYVLSLGDLSSTLVTSDTTGKVIDKVEVGALTGTDDGDGSYYVLVSDQSDPSKALTDNFFAGTVEQGDNFEASGSFGSETFVHIYSSDGGSLLQSINFHTSCSSPLIIGDQYGSITLEGATLVGKDSNTEYTVGATETDGDAGVIYEITKNEFDDDGNPIFQVDPDTGEVTFVSPPDFENPLGDTPDNKYDIEVTAFFVDENGVKTGEICEVKPLEICVEDQDCIKILENTNPGVIADLDCEEQEPENPDFGVDLCEERDALRDSGVDASKITQLTLSLGETLTTDSSTDQNGKLKVGAIQPGDDGDGVYFIRVSDKDNPNDTGNNFFTGLVNAGASFTFTSAPIRSEFGAETRVHIFDQDGTFLQTINFHTSCSAPIAIGDQYGSITLESGALTDKKTGELYKFGGTAPREVVYEITGGDGFDPDAGTSPFFNVDAATGEVTLAFDPDFENPLDDNGDNNYFVEVTGFFVNADGSREVCEVKPIEICIEDVPEVGSLSGRYFCDTNNNDVDDGQATDPGIGGVLVLLRNPTDNSEIARTFTADDGTYSFKDLAPGTYRVVFRDPDGVLAGKQLVDPNVGDDDTVDSDARGDTDRSVINGIEVVAGQDTPDNDAGAEKTASLGDKVFLDADGDGIQDPGEAGVAGVTVTLTGAGDDGLLGTGDDTTETDVTDADGEYLFTDLNPGEEYKVTFDLSTATSVDPADIEFTQQDAGMDDTVDSDADPANGMTDPVTLAPGENNTTIDAGVVLKLGSLSGRYFCDDNNNDVDDGEAIDPGIPGVVVTLFDAAGNAVKTTTTGDEGVYRFDGLEAGTYSVEFTDPDGVLEGKQLVDPNVGGDDTVDSDAEGDTTLSTIEDIVVEPGEETGDNDAGAEKTASLGDKVFLDADRDGIQDPGEAGVAGVTVTLTGAGDDGLLGTGDDTTETDVTDADGEYLFTDLNPGEEYKVTFDLSTATSVDPADIEFTQQDAGMDDAVDSDADPANGMTDPVTLAPGENNTTIDAGVVLKLGSLSGRYFCDDNNNDVDDGEAIDPGIPGVVVTLFDAAGNAVKTTTTGDEGVYRFDGLEAGTYSVEFTDPDGVLEGKQLVDPNVGGDDTVDSDAEGDTTLSTIEDIVVEPGEETGDNDAGAEKTASLGDKVFLDADGDGIQDPGEAGVAGVTVTLTGAGDDGLLGTGDDTTETDVTDADGEYLFTDLNPGEEYKVTFDLSTATSVDPADIEFTQQDAGMDDTVDSDADPANGMTDPVTLAPGENNTTIDAGVVLKLGSLSGRYFCDDNNNDVDDGEAIDPGIPGVVVTLFDAAGNAVKTTTTGDEGVYRFDGLEAGTYSVEFTDPDGVLEGKQLVDPNVGGDDTVDSDAEGDTTLSTIEDIVVEPGEETGDNDAGAEKTASLGDKVFLDADRDGIQDPGEAGVAGVTVTLTGAGDDGLLGTGDDTTETDVTDADGEYLFTDLNPGEEYKVTFDLSTATSVDPADIEFTQQDAGMDDAVDSDADPANGMTDPVTLAPGENNTTIDAGVVLKLGSLSGRYFCDDNNNDVDDGEAIDPGIPGVVVTLFDAAGNAVKTTTTGDEGVYRFDGLEAGTYSVEFTDPDGVLEGKQLVDPNVGGDDTVDSDAEGDTTLSTIEDIVVEPGEETGDNDAGAEKTASLGDKVFLDADRDGIQDPGEAGVAGVTVTLTGAGDDGLLGTGDDTTETDVTDADGEYLFTDLNPGEEYKVTFDLSTATSVDPADIEFTQQDAGMDDAVDSDADPANGMTDPVTLDPGEFDDTVDAGVVLKLGSISGRYFCDDNRDGLDNDGPNGSPSTGIEGVLVELLDSNGIPTGRTTTTGPTGNYAFAGLSAGTYGVKFTDTVSGKILTTQNVDGNNSDDIDSDALGIGNNMSEIAGIEVVAGQDTPDNDAGVYPVEGDTVKGCADELIETDFKDNLSEANANGGSFGITMIAGQSIAPGDTVTVQVEDEGGTVRNVDVTRAVDDPSTFEDETDLFIFNGEAAFADLDIGEEATASFEVKIEDSNGNFATASIDVTFCGDANSIQSLCETLPSTITYSLDESFIAPDPANWDDSGYDLKIFVAEGDDRLEGVTFTAAYCLDLGVNVVAGDDVDTAPKLGGALFCSIEPGAADVLNVVVGGDAQQALNMINWILNQDFEGQGYAGFEVQAAIWSITDAYDYASDLADFPVLGDEADVDFIVAEAMANGTMYTPGVGDVVGLIIDPSDLDPANNRQPFIVGAVFEDLDCLC